MAADRSAPSFDALIEIAVRRALADALEPVRADIAALGKRLPPQMGSVADAAKALGCSKRQVFRLIKDGRIAARKVGTRTVIDLAALNTTGNETGGQK